MLFVTLVGFDANLPHRCETENQPLCSVPFYEIFLGCTVWYNTCDYTVTNAVGNKAKYTTQGFQSTNTCT